MKRRIIIADDHLVVRQGLREILGQRGDLEIVAEASDGDMAEQLARSNLAELMILDIGLPLQRGISVVKRLRADGYVLPVLFFSMYPASQYAETAKNVGAQGFVGKEASASELLGAVERVLGGGTSFPLRKSRPVKSTIVGDCFASLSKREQQVMQGLLTGTSLSALGHSMGVSTKTISTYRARLLKKLEVQSNAELLTLALSHGIL